MNENNSPFSKLIGQPSLKSKLQFAIEAKESGRPLPHFLFVSPFGFGKTRFVREFAKHITNAGKNGKYVEINAANIKNVEFFVEKIYLPYLKDRDNAIILIDECHELPKQVQNWLLTVLNTEKSPIRRVTYEDSEIEFDFLKTSIHFATTDANKLGKALKSRMELMTFAPYSNEDLKNIIEINTPDLDYQDNVLEEVVANIKSYPRAAEIMSRKINDYCAIKGRKNFDAADFVNLSRMADIKQHGLDDNEIGILRLLKDRGPMTLTEISACLNIPATAIRQDHEFHLIKKNFIKLDGKRHITAKGKEALNFIKE